MSTPSKLWISTAAVLLLLIAGASPVLAAGGFPTNVNLTSLTTGSAPRGVVVFDDNLGRHDIAVANGGSNNVTVFIGSCTPGATALSPPVCTYAAGVNYAVGKGPTSIARGHFRTKAHWDLVTTTFNDGMVWILQAKGTAPGNGTFAAAVKFPVGTAPEMVAVGDFNGDGLDDIAVTNATGVVTPTVTVLLNTTPLPGGPLSFTPAPLSPYTLPNSVLPWGITTANFQNKHATAHPAKKVPDLVAANYYSGFFGSAGATVLLNDGAGGFASGITSYAAGFYTPYVAAGHFTSGTQTYDDFVVTQYGGNVDPLLNDGTGTSFTPTSPAFFPTGSSSTLAVAAADFDGDGLFDLVVTNFTTKTVTVLQASGAGAFSIVGVPITVGNYPDAVAIADLGNGRLDALVVLQGDNKVVILTP